MKISDRLKELRRKKGLTQEKLAEALNISKSSISMYENGNREPNFDKLIKLSRYFNVSTDYLFGRDNISCRVKGGNRQ